MENLLTRITHCRREFKDYTADELKKVIENISIIENERVKEEVVLHDKLEEIEKSRIAHVSVLEEQGIAVPPELKKELTIKDLKPRRRPRRQTKKQKEAEALQSIIDKK